MSLFKRDRTQAQLMKSPRPVKLEGWDAAIKGKQVALWRPPHMIAPSGQTAPGVSKELIADYLVASTSAAIGSSMGPVTVKWDEQEGRFATVIVHVHAWNQQVKMLVPVGIVSQKLAAVVEQYREGLGTKVQELHKGRQMFGPANEQLARAMRALEHLRDDKDPQFSDQEYMFVAAAIGKALNLSAFIPVGKTPPENIFEGHVTL